MREYWKRGFVERDVYCVIRISFSGQRFTRSKGLAITYWIAAFVGQSVVVILGVSAEPEIRFSVVQFVMVDVVNHGMLWYIYNQPVHR